MRYLSLCAIAKNENDYLNEWVAYHLAVGIEHFYIYDNESTIPVRDTLKPYIDDGTVEVIDFPGRGKQIPAYNHCLAHFGNQSRWIAVIDCDEFINPKAKDDVKVILQDYHNFSGLGVNWIIFGHNDHQTRPQGLVMENYTKASPKGWKENRHIKSIIQPKYTLKDAGDPHHFIYKVGFCVDENKKPVAEPWCDNTTNIIQINHYFSKSLEEYKTIKLARPRADVNTTETARKLSEFYDFGAQCTIEDKSILRFVDKTKSLMK